MCPRKDLQMYSLWKKGSFLADNMEDFELCEEYFYINTSSFNNEKGNWHWLASPFWTSKTDESFSAKTISNWKIELRSKLFFPWVKVGKGSWWKIFLPSNVRISVPWIFDSEPLIICLSLNFTFWFCFFFSPSVVTFRGARLLRFQKNDRAAEGRKWNYFSFCKS